jgi:tRNA(fMet)-specific endonuclease VapC
VNYLLDTNVCIALLNGDTGNVRKRFEASIESGHNLHLSSIVVFELWYGVMKSSKAEKNTASLMQFLAAPIQSVEFDDEDARVAGAHRAALETIGKPIGPYDLLIAGQAMRRDWTLVTANVSEFSRIKALNWEDWANG